MIFERTLVWSEVTSVGDGLIRGDLERNLNLGKSVRFTFNAMNAVKKKLLSGEKFIFSA